MIKAMVASAFIAAFVVSGVASAARPTCRDLLVGEAPRLYRCEGVSEDLVPTVFNLTFDANPAQPSGPSFFGTVNLSQYFCSCDAKGTVKKAKYHAAKTFTCVRSVTDGGAVLWGKVAGKGGSKIVKLQLVGTPSLQIVGSCSLQP